MGELLYYDEEEEWNRALLLYDAVLKEISTKLEILNNEFKLAHQYNPIEHITSRIKSASSIARKIRIKGKELTVENILKYINDVAGVRIICSFTSDIYRIADAIAKQDDVTVLKVKDYIANPKPNGYMSYHMIVSIPIFLSNDVIDTKVEIQIRTIAMDFWASLEHKIYYKFEGNNTSGSHKLNSAIAQAYYAKDQGLKGVTTETGAGQWGTALSMACSYLDLDCKVYMVKCSYEQKPFRREVMRTYGASVTPSPSETTEVGRKILAEHPGTSGSLGCAISEAVEVATHTPGYRYVLGSVLNQVLLHQSVIGVESKIAMDKYGIKPDIIIGCAGGGSNLGGLISPFMGEKLRGEADYQFIAVEPASCPSLTRGVYAYDYCDTGMVCPLSKMYTLGSGFIPSASHAGGLRYHGMSSVLSQLYEDGYMEARSVEQTEVFKAAEKFARVEGILPAPESSHAIKVAIDEALKCKETGEEKTIFFGLTGTGYFDMYAYEKFHDGKMSDYIPSDEELKEALGVVKTLMTREKRLNDAFMSGIATALCAEFIEVLKYIGNPAPYEAPCYGHLPDGVGDGAQAPGDPELLFC